MELFHDTLFLSPSCGVYWHCLKPFLGCCIPYHPCTPYHVTKATCILRSVAQIETLKFTKIRLLGYSYNHRCHRWTIYDKLTSRLCAS